MTTIRLPSVTSRSSASFAPTTISRLLSPSKYALVEPIFTKIAAQVDKNQTPLEQVLDEGVAYLMTHLLKGVIDSMKMSMSVCLVRRIGGVVFSRMCIITSIMFGNG